MKWILASACLALACCAPRVDGPAEQQRARDRADGERLAAQLAVLPGVVKTEVVLQRVVHDPLADRIDGATTPRGSALSMVVIVDDRTDRAALATTATALARTLAPDVQPTLVVEIGATRAKLAKVGPFQVEARSKAPLKATLAIALVLIAGLAAWIALRGYRDYRRGSSAQ